MCPRLFDKMLEFLDSVLEWWVDWTLLFHCMLHIYLSAISQCMYLFFMYLLTFNYSPCTWSYLSSKLVLAGRCNGHRERGRSVLAGLLLDRFRFPTRETKLSPRRCGFARATVD